MAKHLFEALEEALSARAARLSMGMAYLPMGNLVVERLQATLHQMPVITAR